VRPSPPWLPWFPEAARWPRDGDVDGADRATRGDNALVEAAGSWKLGWWKARTASGSRLRLASRASPTPHEYGESGAPAWVHLVHRGRGPERRRRRRPSVQYSAWDHGSTAHRRRRRAESEKPDARRHAHAPTQAARRAQATKALCRPWRGPSQTGPPKLSREKNTCTLLCCTYSQICTQEQVIMSAPQAYVCNNALPTEKV
jgi:hypothetical protein